MLWEKEKAAGLRIPCRFPLTGRIFARVQFTAQSSWWSPPITVHSMAAQIDMAFFQGLLGLPLPSDLVCSSKLTGSVWRVRARLGRNAPWCAPELRSNSRLTTYSKLLSSSFRQSHHGGARLSDFPCSVGPLPQYRPCGTVRTSSQHGEHAHYTVTPAH